MISDLLLAEAARTDGKPLAPRRRLLYVREVRVRGPLGWTKYNVAFRR